MRSDQEWPFRRWTSTTTTRHWEWTEIWGPQISDVTKWRVTLNDGGSVEIVRNSSALTLRPAQVTNVLQALLEAVAADGPSATEEAGK